MDRVYADTIRLLLDVAPEVFAAGGFAMKGGTAINLFVRDMPRVSRVGPSGGGPIAFQANC